MNAPTKKCAVINDFSGVGRCSLSVALPIISAMGVQCCSLPTAILSNHTGYDDFFFESYTDKMPAYISKWEKLSLCFDVICSGFLGSAEQCDIVLSFIEKFKASDCKVIIDPVLADNGKLYSTCDKKMLSKMKTLVSKADIITPNITEACMLCGEKYYGEEIDDRFANMLAEKLCKLGNFDTVLTGIIRDGKIGCAVFDRQSRKITYVFGEKAKKTFPGTGDIFTSIISACISRGDELLDACRLACDFISQSAIFSSDFDTDVNDGIAFEPFLSLLIKGESNESR